MLNQIIIIRNNGVVILTASDDEEVVVKITEEQLEDLVNKSGCTEEEIGELLVLIEQQRMDNNLIDGRKRLKRVRIENIQSKLAEILNRFSIDKVSEAFSDMKFSDIQEIFKSDNPCLEFEMRA